MCKELVALLGRSIQTYWMVHIVVRTEWHLRIAAVNTATAGIHQMLHWILSAGFKDIVKTYYIAFYIGVGILNTVSYPRLGGQIHNNVEVVLGKKLVH